jgi:hypothetical protein
MSTVAPHTTLRAGAEAEYDRVHATIPDGHSGTDNWWELSP